MTVLSELSNNQIFAGLFVAAASGLIGFAARPILSLLSSQRIFWSMIFDTHFENKDGNETYYAGSRRYIIKNKSFRNVDEIKIIISEKPQSFSFENTVEFSTTENPDGKFIISINGIQARDKLVFNIYSIKKSYSTRIWMAEVKSVTIKGGRSYQVLSSDPHLIGEFERLFSIFKNFIFYSCCLYLSTWFLYIISGNNYR